MMSSLAELKIYTTPKCRACKELKQKLLTKRIYFREVDITKVEPKEQLKLKITSVPTVFWKGKRYEGRSIKEIYE